MRKYSLEQYKQGIKRFNRMSFYDQIDTIRENKDILTLASDTRTVKVKDKTIQENLKDQFQLKKIQINDLIKLLGINE